MTGQLLVKNYKIKFITTNDGRFLENIILELFLENNQVFRMGGIPLEIATEIRKYLSKPYSSKKDLIGSDDMRYTFFDSLLDFPDIEKILYESIEKIIINYYDSGYNIYGATVELNEKYTIAKKRILMIPSHAILLALLANRKVYVSRDLVEEQTYIVGDLDDFFKSSPDDFDDEDM